MPEFWMQKSEIMEKLSTKTGRCRMLKNGIAKQNGIHEKRTHAQLPTKPVLRRRFVRPWAKGARKKTDLAYAV